MWIIVYLDTTVAYGIAHFMTRFDIVDDWNHSSRFLSSVLLCSYHISEITHINQNVFTNISKILKDFNLLVQLAD